MERLTRMTAEELIAICENKMQGKGCIYSSPPACFFINELGVCAVEEKDRTAQKYLIGLLGQSNEEVKFIALIYLLQMEDLEPGDRVILDGFKEKRKNIPLVQQANMAIRDNRESAPN